MPKSGGYPSSPCFPGPRKTALIDEDSTRSTPHSIAKNEGGYPPPQGSEGQEGGSLKNIRKGGGGCLPRKNVGGTPCPTVWKK